MPIRLPALLAASICACFAAAAQAESTRIVVPFPPGSVMDRIARIVAAPLGAQLGQPVRVENRPGANGLIGTEAAARSLPDGKTLLLGSADTHAVNALVFGPIRYHPVRDFVPVGLIGEMPMTLLVDPSLLAAVKLRNLDVRPPAAYWIGIFVAAGTPEPIVMRLNGALKTSTGDAAVRSALGGAGIEIADPGTPAEFARYLEVTHADWARTVREVDIKVDLK